MDLNVTRTTWPERLTSYPVRLVVYGLITMAVFEALYALLQSRGAVVVASESGPIERIQVVCLLLGAVGIGVAVWWTPIGRAVLVATGATAVYAAARESDSWFEANFFNDAYKWLIGAPLAMIVVSVAYRERSKLIDETLRMSVRPGSTLFTIAGIYLCFFCQLLDRPGFWSEAGISVGVNSQKLLVEESAELFAYLLIAYSGCEALIAARHDRRLMSDRSSTARSSTSLNTIRRAA
jgi:hypothetical protein